MATAGRPERINDDLVAKFVELVADGMTITRTCQTLAINDGVWRRWRAQGDTDLEAGTDSVHARLSAGVQEARREAERRAVHAIRAAGFGVKMTERTTTTTTKPDGAVVVVEVVREKVDRHWTALAWWLERTIPEVYAKVTRQWVSGPEGEPVQLEPVESLRDKLELEMERLAEQLAENDPPAELEATELRTADD